MKYLVKITNKYNNTEEHLSNIKSIKSILNYFTLLEGDTIEVFSKNNILVNNFKFLEERRALRTYKGMVISRSYLIQKNDNKLEAYLCEYGTNNIIKHNKK